MVTDRPYEVRVRITADSRAEALRIFDAIVAACPDHEGATLIRPVPAARPQFPEVNP